MMQAGYNVRRIGAEEWRKYKRIRLEALRHDPQAFASSYEREAARTDEDWQSRIAAATGEFIGVESGGDFLAIGGAYAENDAGEWNVVAIYVSPEHRGQGLGRILMEGIIGIMKDRGDVRRLVLDVNVKQTAAIGLYESCGFRKAETKKDQLMGDGNRYDEYEMVMEF